MKLAERASLDRVNKKLITDDIIRFKGGDYLPEFSQLLPLFGRMH